MFASLQFAQGLARMTCLSASWGLTGSTLKMAHSHGWQRATVIGPFPLYVSFSIGFLFGAHSTWRLQSSQAASMVAKGLKGKYGSRQGRSCHTFHGLASDVTSCHLHDSPLAGIVTKPTQLCGWGHSLRLSMETWQGSQGAWRWQPSSQESSRNTVSHSQGWHGIDFPSCRQPPSCISCLGQ